MFKGNNNQGQIPVAMEVKPWSVSDYFHMDGWLLFKTSPYYTSRQLFGTAEKVTNQRVMTVVESI